MKANLSDYPEFQDALQHKELVFLFGTGISSALTGKRYSWWKWICDGISGLKDRALADSLQKRLEADPSAHNMVQVVGDVLAAAKSDGTYTGWMSASFETNHVTNDALAKTLQKLSATNSIFATTNYDLLLEEATGLRALSYEQPMEVFAMLERRRADAVIHIHGIYDTQNKVDNIVGSQEQYDAVLNDKGAQFLQNILGTKTLVFIGCGKTTEDVNISQFVEFAARYLKLDRPYYFLYNAASPVDSLPDNIHPVPYGDDYADLPGFLEDMAQERFRTITESTKLVGRTLYTETSTDVYGLSEYHFANEHLPFCGRNRELGQLKRFLENDAPSLWWAITGQAGAGKSRLAFELMKHTPTGYFSFFLNPSADAQQARQFIPFCDTLVILDYVLGNEENLAQVVNALCDVFTDYDCYKLRFLFLEREGLTISGTWYYNLEQAFQYGDRNRFRKAEYKANLSSKNHEFLHIDDLDEDAVLELIQNVCTSYGLPKDPYRDRTLRDAYGKKYEQLRFRPLFLQIYVQAWIENGQTDIDYHGYRDLLNAVLDKEQEHLLNVVDQGRSCLSSLILLMVRASVSPLDTTALPNQYLVHWQTVKAYVQNHALPGIERRERIASLYRDAAQVSDLAGDVTYISPQYPDMIKEALFLRYVDDFEEFGEELWENAPDAFAMFLYRCIVDFPDAAELFDYVRKITEDCGNVPAMHARIALLKHEIITADDRPAELLDLADTEYAYWRSVDSKNELIQDVRIEGLNAALRQHLGWSREKEAFAAIEEIAKSEGAQHIQEKKCLYLMDTVTYLTSRRSYLASEKVISILKPVLDALTQASVNHHPLQLALQVQHLFNRIGLIQINAEEQYNDADWDAAWQLCEALEASCDLTACEDAEVYTYALAECTRMAFAKLAGKRIYEYADLLQDYAVQWAEDQSVAFNDKIHYHYLLGKYYYTDAICLGSTMVFGKANYAARVVSDYVDELEKNVMVRDFAGLLVGGWMLKVGYDETVTDRQAKRYLDEAEKFLEAYPDSEFLCARYMELLDAVASAQFKQDASKEYVEKAYPLLLRFPQNEDVLDAFFRLLKNSTESGNWHHYIQSKQIVNGLILNNMQEYLFPAAYTRQHRKIGANEPCPCGSRKKFKKCCRGKGIYD